jgi:RNA polymerase sigma-70 factor (ECF subfamily)
MDPSSQLQAFVKLLTLHQGDVRAYIVSLMPGSPDVGDVLQETNIVIWNKRDEFELGTNFIAWSFAIARYQVLQHRRRSKHDSKVILSDKLVDMLAEMEPPRVSHEAYLQALDRCMEKLDPKQRSLITCRYTPGRSLQSLADADGVSAGSLRISLMRIRSALKRCIESQGVTGTA